MALATRPKPNVHHKKRQAGHHRHNQDYVKTYWPFLPVLAIMGTGIAIDRSWTPAASSQASLAGSQAEVLTSATRLQAVTGSSSTWVATAVVVIAVIALVIFLARHTLAFNHMVVKGKHFVTRHPFFDIVAALIFTTGFVLVR